MKYIVTIVTLACLASCKTKFKIDQNAIDVTSYGYIPACMKEDVR